MSTVQDAPAREARSYRSYTRPVWWRLLLNREAAVIAALVAVILWAIYFVPFFGNQLTMTFLLLDIAPILLIALPMTMVIITGEIDLSVASVVGLSSVLLGSLVNHGWSVPAAMVVALLAGIVCGLLNGFLVAYVGLPSLAVTIGTLALYRGIAVGLLGTKAVTDFPSRWTRSGQGEDRLHRASRRRDPVPGARHRVRAAAALLVFGRGIYDIGLNAEAAQFTGVSVARTKLLLFVMTSVVSAFAGIYFTLRFSSSRGDNATGLELQVIAAVLLGGVSIFGGRGKPSRRHRRRPADRRALECPAPAGDHGQRHQHHHRGAAHRLRDVHECPGLVLGPERQASQPEPEPVRPHHARASRRRKPERGRSMKFPTGKTAGVAAVAAGALAGTGRMRRRQRRRRRRRQRQLLRRSHDHVHPEEPRQPLLRHQRRGWREGGQGVRRQVLPGRPAGGQPRRPGAVHRHRGPEAHERDRDVRERPEGAVRLDQERA